MNKQNSKEQKIEVCEDNFHLVTGPWTTTRPSNIGRDCNTETSAEASAGQAGKMT